MNFKKNLIAYTFLFLTFSGVFSLNHRNQFKFQKESPKPLTFSLTKAEKSNEQKKAVFSLLQASQNQIKNPALLQTAKKAMNLDESPKRAELPLENHFNTIYTAEIGIGSSDNLFKLVFDTGSVSVFVDSELCSAVECKSQHQYDHTASESYVAPIPPLEMGVEYGTGALTGVKAIDTFYFGDLVAEEIVFFEIKDQNELFTESSFDGIFGLSKPFRMEQGKESSVFDTLYERKLIPENLFTFYLARGDGASTLSLGGYDENRLASEIKWFNVIHESYWMIKLDQVLLGDTDTKICNENCAAIIDSGTSLLTAPELDLQVMSQLIGDVDCQNYKEMPTINFVMGGHKFGLTPDEYVVTLKGTEIEFYTHSAGIDIEDCAGAFMPFDIVTGGRKVWILGDTFMSKHVVIFDRENNRVGFADPK